MKASVGDWLVVHSHIEGSHDRRAVILGTGEAGAPPYTVRWVDEDRQALVFPGPDSQILSAQELHEHARAESELIDHVQADIARRPVG